MPSPCGGCHDLLNLARQGPCHYGGGHWLAAEVISAWAKRAELIESSAIAGRIQ
jgi:hypothetical protein